MNSYIPLLITTILFYFHIFVFVFSTTSEESLDQTSSISTYTSHVSDSESEEGIVETNDVDCTKRIETIKESTSVSKKETKDLTGELSCSPTVQSTNATSSWREYGGISRAGIHTSNGGRRTNQDAFSIIEHKEFNSLIIIVLGRIVKLSSRPYSLTFTNFCREFVNKNANSCNLVFFIIILFFRWSWRIW